MLKQKTNGMTDKKFQIAMVKKYGRCLICGGTYGLVAHHYPHTKGARPDLRHDENNIVVLDFYCHQAIHGKNRKEIEQQIEDINNNIK